MSKKKILVTGASGLVGSRFIELAKNYEFFTPDLPDFDITDLESVKETIKKFNPEWIVNFAAFTDVNAAEEQFGDESGLVWKVNVKGVENILESFPSQNIIQISTDMVFPGTITNPGPYPEDAETPSAPNGLTWYGWTKNRAEKLVLRHGGTILRIIYPVRSSFDKKLDYIRGALQKFVDGKMYPLFNDQQMCVAFIDEVAYAIEKIIDSEARGVYHASSDTTNPYDLITRVVSELGEDTSSISSASIIPFLATQKNPNRYPQYGGLKTKTTEEKLDARFSTWQTVIEYLIGQGLGLPTKK